MNKINSFLSLTQFEILGARQSLNNSLLNVMSVMIIEILMGVYPQESDLEYS